MPFNGIPNAGAPDPQWFSMLLQAQQNRAQLEMAQQKAMLEAQANAEKQRRLEEAHRQKLDIGRMDMLIKLRDALQPELDASRRNAETAGQGMSREDLLGNGGGMDFAQIVQQNMPGRDVGAEVQANDEAQAKFNSDAMLASQIYQQIHPDMAPEDALNAALGGGRTVESQRARTADLAEQVKLQEEARANAESNRRSQRDFQEREQAARNAEGRLIARPTEQIRYREKELQRLSNKIADPKITGQDRELAENQYRAIKAEANADLTRSQPPSVIAENRKQAQDNFEYDQVYDQSQAVKGLVRTLESGDSKSIGLEGWATEVLGNFKSLVDTTSQVPFINRYTESLQTVLDNPANTPEEKQRIIDNYFSQDIMDRVASGQLTEQSMRWWFMYSLNPDGRVSNMLAKDTQERTDIIGPGVSRKLALSRLRAMSRLQDQYLRRRRGFITKVNPGEAFDPTSGRRVASESLPTPQTAPSSGPAKGTAVAPNVSTKDAAAAILRQQGR